MRVRKSRRSCERGAAIFESMAALTVLCLLFFALLQIFYWCIQTQFCEYAAFYASKSVALGSRPKFCLRAARVAAISISGPRRGRTNLSEKEGAELYMTEGDASGVYYDYWYPQRSTAPELTLTAGTGPVASSTIQLKNAPLLEALFANFARVFMIGENPEPKSSVGTYNYSLLYME